MKSLVSFFKYIVFGSFILLVSCTGNDILDDEIAPYNKKSFTGKVTLSGESDHSTIYVWIDGFDIGTYTNASGEFTLTIPASSGQKGITSHRVYYFLSDFTVDSDTVSVKDGNFEFGVSALNHDGKIKNDVVLKKAFEFVADVNAYPLCPIQIKFLEPTKLLVPYNRMIMVGLSNFYVTTSYKYKEVSGQSHIKKFEPSNLVEISGSSSNTFFFFIDLKHFETLPVSWGNYQLTPFVFGNYDKIPPQMLDNLISDYSDLDNFENYVNRLNFITFQWHDAILNPPSN